MLKCILNNLPPVCFFPDTNQEGGGDNVLAACANFDRTNGFYEDHSGADQ